MNKEHLLSASSQELVDMIIEQSLVIKSKTDLTEKYRKYIEYLESQIIKLKDKLYKIDPNCLKPFEDL